MHQKMRDKLRAAFENEIRAWGPRLRPHIIAHALQVDAVLRQIPRDGETYAVLIDADGGMMLTLAILAGVAALTGATDEQAVRLILAGGDSIGMLLSGVKSSLDACDRVEAEIAPLLAHHSPPC